MGRTKSSKEIYAAIGSPGSVTTGVLSGPILPKLWRPLASIAMSTVVISPKPDKVRVIKSKESSCRSPLTIIKSARTN